MQAEKRKHSILLPIARQGDALSVFLQRRSADMKSLPNYFGFWGGGIEAGETIEEALVRECREELGKELDLNAVQHFNHYEFLTSVKDVFVLETTQAFSDDIVIGEGDYGKWFSTAEALALTDFIYEDKTVLIDLERRLLGKPIR